LPLPLVDECDAERPRLPFAYSTGERMQEIILLENLK
jgi:hypothetical protein